MSNRVLRPRFFQRQIHRLLALLAITAGAAFSQQPAYRQSMDDAWWTGPMLAPNATTLPRGHLLLEPYLYDVITQGEFDASGTRRSAPHANGFGSLTYMNYGLVDKFTVGLIPTFGYNEPSNGINSAGIGVGDVTVQAQYRLRLFHEGRWLPTTSINVQETMPTGRYDRLGDRPSDGFGSGVYTTTVGLYTQTYLWMPNGRILRMRFNLSQAFSRAANVEDVSVYGTPQGFRGHAYPGSSFLVDAAWEYSVTRHWVLALDAIYRHQGNTPVIGYNLANANQFVRLDSGLSEAYGLAPAIEYNLNSRVGILLGTRLFPAGRNTSASITPAIAVNIVH